MCPDGKIPAGTLIQGKEGIKDQLKKFIFMKKADAENEKWHGPRRQTIDLMKDFKEGFAQNYHNLIEQYQQKPRNVTMPTFQNKRNSLLPIIPELANAKKPMRDVAMPVITEREDGDDFKLYGPDRDRVDSLRTVSELNGL